MKKVLFFSTSGNYFGGGVMCLVETLRYLDRNEIIPYVLLPTHGSTEKVLHDMGIKTFVIRSYDWLYPSGYIGSLDYWIKRPFRCIINNIAEKRIYKLLRKEDINAYHLNSIYNDCGVLSAAKLNIPVFWHIREFVDGNSWTSTFANESHAYRKISSVYRLLAVSQCVKDYYQKKMPHASIQVVNDGVDFNDKGKIRTTKDFHCPLRLSMIGGVSEVKGHEDALYALKLLANNGVSCILTIYGRSRDSVYLKKLHQIIQSEGVEKFVHFAGNSSDMAKVWDNTDIVLVCSKSESFGRVAVEAMYHGVPVVGADNTGTRELITQDVYGILYKTGDALDLCNKICTLLGSKNVENKIKKGRERALGLTSKRSAEELCKALQG